MPANVASSPLKGMDDVRTFLEAVETANPDSAAATIQNASPQLMLLLYQCLQDAESPEAKQFISWLGRNICSQSTAAPAVVDLAMQFAPQLIWLHVSLVRSTKYRELATNVECSLVCLYNQICDDPNSKMEVRLARLEDGSIYHEAAARQHVSLTVSALNSQTLVSTVGGGNAALKGVDRIIAGNRSFILGCILCHYSQTIGDRAGVSLMAFCHMCTRVCLSGYDLKAARFRNCASMVEIFSPTRYSSPAEANTSSLKSLDPVATLCALLQKRRKSEFSSHSLPEAVLLDLSQRSRQFLEPSVFQEMAGGIHVCLFAGQQAPAWQALHALHWRATEGLIPEVLMMTRALLHSLDGPCGSPDSSLYGLSTQLFSSLPDSSRQPANEESDGNMMTLGLDAPDIAVQAPSPAPSPRHSTVGLPSDIEIKRLSDGAAGNLQLAGGSEEGEGLVETLV